MRVAHMPQQYWHDVVGTSFYLLNHMPSRVLNFHTSLQTLERYVKLPSTLHIPPKIFGYVVFIHVPKHQRSKLDPCVVRCVLGYGSTQAKYELYLKTH